MPVNRAKFHFDNTYAGMDMLYGPYVLYQIGDLSCEAVTRPLSTSRRSTRLHMCFPAPVHFM